MNLESLARIFLFVGAAILIVGGLLFFAARLDLPLGRMPGDIRIERGNFSCMIALGTSIFLSILLTIVLNVVVRLLNK